MFQIVSLPRLLLLWLIASSSCQGMTWQTSTESEKKQDSKLVHWAWNPEAVAQAGEAFWPEFRGPTGDGRAAEQASPPSEWSEEKNVLWKTDIHGQGWSSPVLWGDRLWLTTATLDGKKMSVMAIDVATGKILYDRVLFENDQVQKDHHVTNSYASPTPVLDEKHVYVHFGAYGTAAISRESGETVWERRDLPCNHFRGPGSSPILFKDLLIFHMDGFDFKYVIALDKRTGRTVWKTDRDIDYGTDDGDIHKAYSTPLLIETAWGLQMVCVSSKATIAYEPSTGKPLWRVRYEEYSTTARPIYDGTHVFINTGFGKSHLLAVRPASEGDLTKTQVSWDVSRGIGNKPSHVIEGDYLFSLEDRGMLTCLDRKTGEAVWQERLGGDFSASPIVAGHRVYVFDHEGKSYVYQADGQGKRLAMNSLSSGCRASPIAFGKRLIVRTTSSLYLLGD